MISKMVKEGEVIEMHFEFSDKSKHNIEPCVLISYYSLLDEYCKINNIRLSILPGQEGSFVSNALIIGFGISIGGLVNGFAGFLDTNLGQYISYKTTGKSMEDFKNEAKKEAEEKRNKNLYKKKSAFFKECLECKDIELIKVKKEGEEKSYCEIKREKFYEYVIEDEEDFKKKEKQEEILKLQEENSIKEVKIVQAKNGEVEIKFKKEDEKKIKRSKGYFDIIEKFNKEKEEINLFNRDEKLAKK